MYSQRERKIIARALSFLLSNLEDVQDDEYDDDSVIATITESELRELIDRPEFRDTCKCGETLDKDCMGGMRCPVCDPPCPNCSDGG